MNRMFLKMVSFALVLMMVASFIPAPVSAQGDDDVALIERVIAAGEAIDSYESFVRTDSSSSVIALSLGIPMVSVQITQSDATISEAVSTVVLGDNPNLQSFVTVSNASIQDDGTGEVSSSSLVEAEVRVVDGAVYFNGAVTEVEGDASVSDLPDGWVLVTDDLATTSVAELDDLLGLDSATFSFAELDDFLSSDDSDASSTGADLDQILEILNVANDVSLSQDTLEDGTEVDVITVTLDALEAFNSPAFGSELPDDPATAGLIEALVGDSVFEVNFAIDGDERLVGFYFTFDVDLTTDDLSTVMDVAELGLPEGMEVTLSMVLSLEASQLYTDINSAIAPVEAPADAVPFN